MKATRDWGWWLRLRAGSLLNGTSNSTGEGTDVD